MNVAFNLEIRIIKGIIRKHGTSRDHFRNNPDFVESRRRAHEIYEKHKNDRKK